MECEQCPYKGTNCFYRYSKDIYEFGSTEWICPRCGLSKVILLAVDKSADKLEQSEEGFICNHCGFVYEC
jgi:transcription elongation factor Elf1